MSQSSKHIRNLVLDAVMIAMFVVLSRFMTIQFGNIKITLAALPIIFVAFHLGIIHVTVVAAIAEFLSQLLGYGLTLTTPLWIIPVVVRGVLICILASLLLKAKKIDIREMKHYEYFVILLITGFIVTVLNTAVIALDALIFGYYSYAYVFGDLFFRLVSMVISTVVYTIITKTVIDTLRRVKF